jgi:arylsulfatase A-like enzyme
MIHHMDEGIGWLLDALRDTKQLDNTLIVFTSDNGGERFSDNWPLVGGKMDLTEGGIRVPWIAHWPAVISAGAVSPQHCLTMDWSATMLDLGGATIPDSHPLDGISLRPVLQDPTHLIDRPLFWRMNHRQQRAMRSACWKYLRVDGNDYLFNIDLDARERANLGHREPERLAAMKQAWEDWEATMPPIPEDASISLGYSSQDMPQR